VVSVEVPGEQEHKAGPGRPRKNVKAVIDCGLSENIINDTLQLAFAGMATATQHGHWQRTEQECKPTAAIAKRVLDRMARENPKMFERLSEKTDLGMLFISASTLIAPSVVEELEIRRNGVKVIHSQKTDTGTRNGFGPTIPDVSTLN
jgi:hypothetical protein